MRWKPLGLQVLRLGVWTLLLLVAIRGTASLLSSPERREAAPATAISDARNQEPEGLRALPVLFVTEYLTWRDGGGDERTQRLRPFLARHLDAEAGWKAGPSLAAQEVRSALVYGAYRESDTRWQVTVAARVVATLRNQQPAAAGVAADSPSPDVTKEQILYVTVPVALSEGRLVVYDYPSLVAPPKAASFDEPLFFGERFEDEDGSIRRLLLAFFRDFAAGKVEALPFYLGPGANVPSLSGAYRFDELSELTLLVNGDQHWAVSTVRVTDTETGASYALRYTVEITRHNDRWFIQQLLQKGV